MRIRLLTLLAFLAFVCLARAADVWQGKPVEEWTREETQEFFRDSPWVHQVIVTEQRVAVQPASYPPSTREPERTSSSAEGIKTEPRFGPNGVPVETAYYIEWSSARIVRQAGAHYRTLQGKGREEKQEFNLHAYVLTVSGYDLTVFEGLDETALKKAAYLRPQESKQKIRPAKVEILRGADGQAIAVRYSFPVEKDGQPLISDGEQCVTFVSRAGELRLRTRFNPPEMVIGKGRDL